MAATPRFPRDDLTLATRAIVEIRRRFGAILALGIVSRAVSSLVLAPTFSALITAVVSRKGRLAFGNTDIPGFLLSPYGMLLIVVAGTLVFFAQTAEIAALLILGRTPTEGRTPPAVRAILGTVRALPRLLTLALRQWVALVLLAVPFGAIAGAAYLAFWRGEDLEYLVMSRPPRFWLGATTAAIAALGYAAAAATLIVRWIFAVPILLFEGTAGFAALKASTSRTAGQRWRLFRLAVAWGVSTALVEALAVLALRGVGHVVLGRAGDSLAVIVPTAAALLALHAVTVAALAFAANAFAAFLLLPLYGGPEAPAIEVTPRSPRASRLLILAGVTGVGLVASLASWRLVSGLETTEDLAVTAHRGGAWDAPENSVAAFRKAVADGADFGELDIQLSRDGQIVVFHDQDLMRLFGRRDKVRDLTLAELQTFDLGSTHSPAFRGERIPTLEAIIDAVSGRLRLMIELKVYPGDDTPRLVTDALALIARKGIASTCVVTSLDYGALALVRRHAPAIRTVYLVAESLGDPTRLDVDILSLRASLARPSLIARARLRKKPVHAWTVDTPSAMVRLWDLGVSNVITNDPRGLMAKRAEVRALSVGARLLLKTRYLLAD